MLVANFAFKIKDAPFNLHYVNYFCQSMKLKYVAKCFVKNKVLSKTQ